MTITWWKYDIHDIYGDLVILCVLVVLFIWILIGQLLVSRINRWGSI